MNNSPAENAPKASLSKDDLSGHDGVSALGDRPLVSVIIPVYNDAPRLAVCLAALAQQTYPTFEILVVDNGSEPLDAVQTAVARCPQAILLTEAKPGSYAARNRGIAAASGAILAFTDADCRPNEAWLAEGVAQLQAQHQAQPECGLVAGAIEIVMEDPSHPVELFESVMGLCQEKFVREDHFGATANLFTWPHVFAMVGGFNDGLKSSGDVEWGQRVFAQGYGQRYAAAAVVQHPARASFAQLATQARRHAGGFYDLRCRQAPNRWARNLAYGKLLGFHLMPPVMFAWQMARHPQLKTLGQKLKVVMTLGFVRLVIVKALLQLRFGGTSARE